MNTSARVAELIGDWSRQGLPKADMVVRIAEACLGWPYVWGGAGQVCNKSNRSSYADRSSCPSAEADVIRKKCQILNGSKGTCNGCKWYPDGNTLFFDCRGFTRWCLSKVGISLAGAGATSQWKDSSNWSEKGTIDKLPRDKVCCVFYATGDTMNHTGLYIGDGNIIHCSGEVKRDVVTSRIWTHYAVPKGLSGNVDPGTDLPTLRKGSSGEYVTLLQTKLIQRGYSLDPYGADGKYGNKTVEAVKQFQRDNGLSVDGVTGKNTWNAILSGGTTLYTVTIQHVSKSVADDIIKKYGGTMKKEGD